MKIVADPNIPFVREAFADLGVIELVPGREITTAAVREADLLLVRSVTPVNAALLDGSRVRFVATATIGTDHVDEAYLGNLGIGFASAAGSNANSVAEYVVAALLEIAHRERFRLRDKTLGVIGVGNVGARVVRYAEALGLRVLPNDPPRQRAESLPQFVPLERVLAEADIITLHVPLTKPDPASPPPEGPGVGSLTRSAAKSLPTRGRFVDADATFHLLDRSTLSALRQKPILINTARGAVIDNRALLAAIDGDKLGPVVLDVWENEPNISPELLEVVDLATPHIAGYSLDGKVNGTRLIYEAACRFFAQPPTWQPTLPPPTLPQIELSVGGQEDDEDALRRVISRVYNITADDTALRQAPRAFDRLRAEYPIRREFTNTIINLQGGTGSLRGKLAALGFRLPARTG